MLNIYYCIIILLYTHETNMKFRSTFYIYLCIKRLPCKLKADISVLVGKVQLHHPTKFKFI